MSIYRTKSWQDVLPPAYHWLDKIAFERAKAVQNDAWLLVAVVKGEAGAVSIDAPSLQDEFKAKILQYSQAVGWKANSGSLKMVVDGVSIVAVVQSSLAVSLTQKGRQLGIDAAHALRDVGFAHLMLAAQTALDSLDIWEGFATGCYDNGLFKERVHATELPSRISFLGAMPSEQQLHERLALIRSVYLTRMLQDAPPNWLGPERFAQIAQDLMKDQPHCQCQVFGPEQLFEFGMGAFLAVAAGALTEPRLIVIEIKGDDPTRTIALVGKGITFDSGGISIKPGAGMAEMKYDMSGGAAVLGAAYYLTTVRPPVNVVCVIGAVENMPSGNATRPGDIVQAMNGKTIEVLNTDAEGRLVLADMMCYVTKHYKPELMLDIATLTGAVLHGLGHAGAGFMTNHQDLADFLKANVEKCGEPLWQLPLWPELTKEVKSDIADYKNIPKPSVLASTIIGGIFLREFVANANCRWAHLDIAGTAWACSATGFPSNGGSSFGLRTLINTCFANLPRLSG